MSIAVVTGAGGLVGSEAALFLASQGMDVVGIDNDMRQTFFGPSASTKWSVADLERTIGPRYRHESVDIRDRAAIERIFRDGGTDIALVLHAAAQPSHDWAAREPHTDFSVNATGTLTLLEAARQYAPRAVFIFTSTNKVYGDRPNALPLIEEETRWELQRSHAWHDHGVPEEMSIDSCMHSLFGASKVAADLLVQEYGRYFGMATACFRGGCLTGPRHSGTQLHGFLAYLMKCAAIGREYTVFGYKGKQVRDNIHAEDLVAAFWEVFKAPRVGEVYNIGGGRFSNCSMLEAISIAEEIAGRPMRWQYSNANRAGDHIWWISDCTKFQQHYPGWHHTKDVSAILNEIHQAGAERWSDEAKESSATL